MYVQNIPTELAQEMRYSQVRKGFINVEKQEKDLKYFKFVLYITKSQYTAKTDVKVKSKEQMLNWTNLDIKSQF